MHTGSTLGHYQIVSAIGKAAARSQATSVPPINMILNWPQLLDEK